MRTRKKSETMRFLESIAGRPLTLGGLLESIRLGEEISQAAFAEKLGISVSHLCDIEKGRKVVSPERAARFAKILAYLGLCPRCHVVRHTRHRGVIRTAFHRLRTIWAWSGAGSDAPTRFWYTRHGHVNSGNKWNMFTKYARFTIL